MWAVDFCLDCVINCQGCLVAFQSRELLENIHIILHENSTSEVNLASQSIPWISFPERVYGYHHSADFYRIFTAYFLRGGVGGGWMLFLYRWLYIARLHQHHQFLKNFVMLSSLAIPTCLFVTQFPFVNDHDRCVADHAAQLVRMCLSCWWKRRWRRIWSVAQETGDWIEADWPLFTPPPPPAIAHMWARNTLLLPLWHKSRLLWIPQAEKACDGQNVAKFMHSLLVICTMPGRVGEIPVWCFKQKDLRLIHTLQRLWS
jgi:hypothetical protein